MFRWHTSDNGLKLADGVTTIQFLLSSWLYTWYQQGGSMSEKTKWLCVFQF
jgi:hypothetical protein